MYISSSDLTDTPAVCQILRIANIISIGFYFDLKAQFLIYLGDLVCLTKVSIDGTIYLPTMAVFICGARAYMIMALNCRLANIAATLH